MNKKNIIISSIVSLIIAGGAGYYFLSANDDETCFQYTKTSTCSIPTTYNQAKLTSGVTCALWQNSKSICSGKKRTDTYTRGAEYRCRYPTRSDTSYSVPNQVCQVEFIDTVAPTITDGGIK